MTHSYQATLSENGRIVIPAEFRAELALKPGDKLIIYRDGRGLRITTLFAEIKALQEEGEKRALPGVSVVDELIRERHENARKEHEE